jgi:hypothetical protein
LYVLSNGPSIFGSMGEPEHSAARIAAIRRSSLNWFPRLPVGSGALWFDAGTTMNVSTIALRLTALIVLLASFSDYWAYDRWDPTAPMNSYGSEAVALMDLQGPSPVGLRSTNLPDDRCGCCSPIVAQPAPVIPLPVFSAFSEIWLAVSLASTPSTPVATSPSPPFRDATGFGLTLRI